MKSKYLILCTAISVALQAPAFAQDIGGDAQRHMDEFVAVKPERTISTSYNFSSRESKNKEATSSGVTLSYTRAFKQIAIKEFAFISGAVTDFDSPTTSTDGSIASMGYGLSRKIDDGLYFSLSGFMSKGNTDLQSIVNDADSYTGGLSADIRQSFPIAGKLLGSVHGTYTPRYTRQRQTNNNDSYLAHTLSVGGDIYYALSKEFYVGAGLEARASSREITLAEDKQVLSGGVGAMYLIDDYSISMQYRQEKLSHHNGNLVTFTLSKKF
jgi:hypothetical protein